MILSELRQWNRDVQADAAIERACFQYLHRNGFTTAKVFEVARATREHIALGWLALQWESISDELRARDWVRAFGQSRWRRWRNGRREKVVVRTPPAS